MGLFGSKPSKIDIEPYIGLYLPLVLKALSTRQVAINVIAMKDDDIYQHSPMNYSKVTILYNVTSGIVTHIYVD
jgi:hypothetical protein